MTKFFTSAVATVLLLGSVAFAHAAYPVGHPCNVSIINVAEEVAAARLEGITPSVYKNHVVLTDEGFVPANKVIFGEWGSRRPLTCPVSVFGSQDRDRLVAPESGGTSSSPAGDPGPSE